MPHLPPLRTRHGTRTEPHISPQPSDAGHAPAQPEFQVSEPPRAQPQPLPEAAVNHDDYPVLTHVVAETPQSAPAPSARQAALDAQAKEDEMVDRITARILASLRADLEDIVTVAVREALRQDRR